MRIIMPKLGLTMTQGTITEWLKSPGDVARAEEALAAYETEKVTLELVAPEDGVLVAVLAAAGETVLAGAPVCEFRTLSEGAELAAATAAPPPAATSAFTATPKARALARELGVAVGSLRGSGPEGRVQARDVLAARPATAAAPQPVRATPLARRIAHEAGIDLAALRGGGAEGTITREDVAQAIRARDAAQVAPATRDLELKLQAGERVIPHSALRRTIGERMAQSAFTAPHVTLTTEAEATNLVSARTQLNQELADGGKISYNALIAALVARALREHPKLNARWAPDGIHLLPDVNIALAVDTERGLMTPVLRNLDRLPLPAIQEGFAVLIARALSGKSLPDDFTEGTFTITNLGGLDVDGFTPIINPPQAAILGVGRIVEKPVARDGAVVIRRMVTLSLSFDHRIVDGAPAGKFLQRVKQLIERPAALLL